MKYPLLFLTFLAVSCGEYDYGKETQKVGDIRSLNSVQVSDSELQNLSRVCQALAQKEQTLVGAMNSPLSYSTSQVDCDGNSVPPETVSVVIQQENGRYVLKNQGSGLDFIFPEVVTTSQGLPSEVCSSLQNLVSPIVSGQKVTYIKTSGIAAADCKPESNEVCINIEHATPQANGTSAIVHTKEWMRVKTYSTDSKFIGFVTFRKKIGQGFCGRDEVLTLKASLLTK